MSNNTDQPIPIRPFNPPTTSPQAIEQITWFSDRILFELIRETDDEDVVEWERTLSRTQNGDFNQTHFNDNCKTMHNEAYRLATREEDRTEHRERRLARKRAQVG
jgi:hypothetical protein